MAFDNRIDNENYCDNCIYNHRETVQVPMFETYNITGKLDMMYIGIT